MILIIAPGAIAAFLFGWFATGALLQVPWSLVVLAVLSAPILLAVALVRAGRSVQLILVALLAGIVLLQLIMRLLWQWGIDPDTTVRRPNLYIPARGFGA